MIEFKKYLPIGSVVLLKNANKKVDDIWKTAEGRGFR